MPKHLLGRRDVEDCPRKRMCIIAMLQKKARKAGEEMGMAQLGLVWISHEEHARLFGQIKMFESILREMEGHLRALQRRNLHFKISSYFVLMDSGRSFCGNWHNCSSSNLPGFLSKDLLVYIHSFVYLYTCCL